MEDKPTFEELLRQFRGNLSQTELGIRLKYKSNTTIGKWESGKGLPKGHKVLNRLIEALGLNLQDGAKLREAFQRADREKRLTKEKDKKAVVPDIYPKANTQKQSLRENITVIQSKVRVQMAKKFEGFVARPKEYESVISHLVQKKNQEVAIAGTLTLKGAGGFGKTTLAQAICYDERILSAFPDGVLWVTVGNDGSKVLDGLKRIYREITQQEPKFINIEDATNLVSRELDQLSCLVVIDDVWDASHLQPFLDRGSKSACLMTTRLNEVIPSGAKIVLLDAMGIDQAVELLASNLEYSDKTMFVRLAQQLGNWPLLLNLTNRRLFIDVNRYKLTIEDALDKAQQYLVEHGPTSFDINSDKDRNLAVAASVEASLDELNRQEKYSNKIIDEKQRYLSLAIFPEDISIPFATLATCWGTENDLLTVERLCRSFDNLGLLQQIDLNNQTILLHDVMRSYLQNKVGKEQLKKWHFNLLSAYDRTCQKNWWELPDDDYIYRHLLWHMKEAGRLYDLEKCLLSFRWLQAKIRATDILSVTNDFDLLIESKNRQSKLGLLKSTLQISTSVLAVDKTQFASQLYGRLIGLEKDFPSLLEEILNHCSEPWLCSNHPSLSAPGGNLVFSLLGHNSSISDLSLIGNRKLLSKSPNRQNHRSLMIWDILQGTLLSHFSLDNRGLDNFIITESCRLIAPVDFKINIWNIETGDLLTSLDTNNKSASNLLLIKEDLLIASIKNEIYVWNLENESLIFCLKAHQSRIQSLYLTKENMLVSTSIESDKDQNSLTAKLWNIQKGVILYDIIDNLNHLRSMPSLYFSECGNIIYSNGSHIKIWDLKNGKLRTLLKLKGNFFIRGDWIYVASRLPAITEIWSIKSEILVHSLNGLYSFPLDCLVTKEKKIIVRSNDHTIEVWDLELGIIKHSLIGHEDGVHNLLLTQDGNLISSCPNGNRTSRDHTIKIWNIEKGTLIHSLEGHTEGVDNLLVTFVWPINLILRKQSKGPWIP